MTLRARQALAGQCSPVQLDRNEASKLTAVPSMAVCRPTKQPYQARGWPPSGEPPPPPPLLPLAVPPLLPLAAPPLLLASWAGLGRRVSPSLL